MTNKQWIKNYGELATSANRRTALDIVNSGLDAISTESVISNSIRVEDGMLHVKEEVFDLNKFMKIKVLGFGKASCDAAVALEKILGSKINEGVVIGLENKTCEFIDTYKGTHPRPSPGNVEVGKKINDIAIASTEEDLVIVIVSGGGSALLCYPLAECEQGTKLYEASIKSGISISELNTVRKHISELKGGKLAKLLYPSTVISLIFSDVPGDNYADVASGPTYKDVTSVLDAETIISKYNLGSFNLVETPKEDKYFEKVHNMALVSNKTAVDAMKKRSCDLGFTTKVLSYELYESQNEVIRSFTSEESQNTTLLGAGEPTMKIDKPGGSGGRNLYLGMKAIGKFTKNSVFISLASDGLDNSNAAGAIIDNVVLQKLQGSKLDLSDFVSRFDAYNFFEMLGDGMIITGPTGANVSDIMLLITKK
ncbi:MAG: DUF4147 domain-containing protein [Candidatus Vogelbacteria bacterium]|nr:DUF4147 domain-containing protein [Candidatus Vogelbacteria bacterium]